ncbi:MAG: PhnE/PtxC family ABC transporter permease [Enterococcus sp.]
MQSIKLTPRNEQLKSLFIIGGAVAFFIAAVYLLDLELIKFLSRFADAGKVLKNFLALDFSEFSLIVSELMVSLGMAIASLVVGAILSIIFAFLGAANTAPHAIFSGVIKAFVSIIRAIPALVWILVIVASLGFGNTSAVVGMIFPTVGYLTKSFISSIEEQDPAIIETLQSTGASRLQVITEGLCPLLIPPFLAWLSICLEVNIASSISLGMIGAGGIGSLLMKAIGKYDYGRISAVILCILGTLLIVELFVTQMKAKLR